MHRGTAGKRQIASGAEQQRIATEHWNADASDGDLWIQRRGSSQPLAQIGQAVGDHMTMQPIGGESIQ